MEASKDAADENKEKGRLPRLAAALVAVLFLIGITLGSRSCSEPAEDKDLSSRGLGAWPGRLEVPEAGVAALPRAGTSSLSLTPSRAEDSELSFGDFMDALESEIGKPLAGDMGRRFARAFLADPKLKGVYKEFATAEKEGRRRPAAEFVKQLRRMPEFRRLVNQFVGSPKAYSLALALQANPKLRPLLSDNPPGQARGPRAARRPSSASLGGRRGDLGGLLARGRWQARGAGSPGIQGSIAHALGPETGSGASSQDGTPGQPDQSGASPHEVDPRLAALADAGGEKMRRLCAIYPQFCDGDTIRPEFRPLLDNDSLITEHGLWGACFALKIYSRCLTACQQTPGCVPSDAWGACLDWKDLTQCISACQTPFAQPCQVPPQIFDAHCSIKLCTGADGRQFPCPPPPHPYCAPRWPGDPFTPPGACTAGDYKPWENAGCEESGCADRTPRVQTREKLAGRTCAPDLSLQQCVANPPCGARPCADADYTDWQNGACGQGACTDPATRLQSRQRKATSRCAPDLELERCAPCGDPWPCEDNDYGAWVNRACGKAPCARAEMFQTRDKLAGRNCAPDLGLKRCDPQPGCGTLPCTNADYTDWRNVDCGGGCLDPTPRMQIRQRRDGVACNPPLRDFNCVSEPPCAAATCAESDYTAWSDAGCGGGCLDPTPMRQARQKLAGPVCAPDLPTSQCVGGSACPAPPCAPGDFAPNWTMDGCGWGGCASWQQVVVRRKLKNCEGAEPLRCVQSNICGGSPLAGNDERGCSLGKGTCTYVYPECSLFSYTVEGCPSRPSCFACPP